MLNLLTDPWLPARRRDGEPCVISPAQIADGLTDNPVVAVTWPRADFRVATLEFLTGLVATAYPPADMGEWAEGWHDPPSPETLAAAFAPFAHAFVLDGDGPRFLQDFESLAAEEEPAEDLLIEVAGNSGLLVHPGRIAQLGRPAAAIALYTLQSWAPSGGRGNRTGLRGGGPLVTMVVPRDTDSLWHRIWANVPEGDPPAPADLPQIFPWLTSTITSESGSTVTPENKAHPLQAWWGMPRRIRLVFRAGAQLLPCSLTARPDTVSVTGWQQRPYGPNYAAWGTVHPLTPTYQVKAGEEKLAVHPQPGGIGYRHWIGLVLNSADGLRSPAPAIDLWKNGGRARNLRQSGHARILAAGYDMSNMKARGLVETEMPLFTLPDVTQQAAFDDLTRALVLATDNVAWALRQAVRGALFSGGATVSLDADVLATLVERLWRATDASFFAALTRQAATPEARRETSRWQGLLRREALRLFDEAAPLDPASNRNARIARARRGLSFMLNGYGKAGTAFFTILQLPAPESKRRKTGAAA